MERPVLAAGDQEVELLPGVAGEELRDAGDEVVRDVDPVPPGGDHDREGRRCHAELGARGAPARARERGHDRYAGDPDLLRGDAVRFERPGSLLVCDVVPGDRRVDPESMRVEIGRDAVERNLPSGGGELVGDRGVGQKVRADDRIRPEFLDGLLIAPVIKVVEDPDQGRALRVCAALFGLSVEVSPELGRTVHHREVGFAVDFSEERRGVAQDVLVPNGRGRVEEAGGFHERFGRPGVPCAGGGRKNENRPTRA